eukprot:5727811-Pleurochrysis_carterae.AAC.1
MESEGWVRSGNEQAWPRGWAAGSVDYRKGEAASMAPLVSAHRVRRVYFQNQHLSRSRLNALPVAAYVKKYTSCALGAAVNPSTMNRVPSMRLNGAR